MAQTGKPFPTYVGERGPIGTPADPDELVWRDASGNVAARETKAAFDARLAGQYASLAGAVFTGNVSVVRPGEARIIARSTDGPVDAKLFDLDAVLGSLFFRALSDDSSAAISAMRIDGESVGGGVVVLTSLVVPNATTDAQALNRITADGRYGPRVDTVVIPGTQFHAVSGVAPVVAVNIFDAVVEFGAGNVFVGANVGRLPSHWVTYDIALRWCPLVGTGGNVVLGVAVASVGVGDTLGVSTDVGATIDTAGSDAVLVDTTYVLWEGLAVPASGDDLAIRVGRIRGNPADTLAGSAGLYSVVLTKAS